jgi:hypothetical protein
MIYRRLALLVSLAACGGTTTSGGGNGGNAVSCGTSSCGGDIVGKWNIVGYCGSVATQTTTMPGCAEPLTTDVVGLTVTGTVEYRTDGTYTVSTTSSGTAQVTYPAACLTLRGVTITCEQLDQAVKQQLTAKADAGITSFSCASGAAGACMCTEVIGAQTNGAQGTYSVNGAVLTQGAGSSPETVDYCVAGNRLTETPRSAGGDAGVAFSGAVGLLLEKVP